MQAHIPPLRVLIPSLIATASVVELASATVIDHFQHGPTSLFAPLDDPQLATSQVGLPENHVAGGVREWSYYVLAEPGGSPQADAGVSMSVETHGGGRFIYEPDPGVTAVSFTLRYDGNPSPTESDMDLDLTAGGATALALDFASAEFIDGVGYLDVLMTSPDGRISYYVPISNSPSPFTVKLPFQRGPPHEEEFDPTDVTSITIGTSNGNLDGVFALDAIRTVTELSTLHLALACAIAWCVATDSGLRQVRSILPSDLDGPRSPARKRAAHR